MMIACTREWLKSETQVDDVSDDDDDDNVDTTFDARHYHALK